MAGAFQSHPAAMSTQASDDESLSLAADAEEGRPRTTGGGLTPRASQQNILVTNRLPSNASTAPSEALHDAAQDADTSPPASSVPPLSDSASELTIPASTTRDYAPSTILSNASLLSHEHNYILPRTQKTKGRKAFTAFCHALDLLVPVDISEDVTSMSESSIGKIGKAVQEKGRAMARREKDPPKVH